MIYWHPVEASSDHMEEKGLVRGESDIWAVFPCLADCRFPVFNGTRENKVSRTFSRLMGFRTCQDWKVPIKPLRFQLGTPGASQRAKPSNPQRYYISLSCYVDSPSDHFPLLAQTSNFWNRIANRNYISIIIYLNIKKSTAWELVQQKLCKTLEGK